MKQIYLFLLMVVLACGTVAQPVFNWSAKDVNQTNNLQKMTVSGNEAIIAGFGRTFVKSKDNGSTWTDVGILTPKFDFIDISFSGNSGYLVSNRNKLYDAFPDPYINGVILRTANAGATWTNVSLAGLGSGDDPTLSPNAPECFGMDFQSVGCANDSVVLVFLRWMDYNPAAGSGYDTHSGIFKTTDRGVTWKNLKGDLGSTVISAIVFSDTTCYITGNKVLLKGGVKGDGLTDIFANLKTAAGAGYINDIQAVSDKEIYLVTVAHGVFKSSNGGETFDKYTITGITGGSDIFKVNNNTLVLTGNAGKTRISSDGGTTWKDAGLAISIWEVGGVLNDSLVLLAKSDIYKIKVSDLSGTTFTWVNQTLSPNNNIHKLSVLDASHAMLIGLGQTFLRTSDKGVTWSTLALPEVPLLDNDLNFNGLRNNGDTAVACMNRFYLVKYPTGTEKHDLYFQGGLFRTTDNWNTWSSLDVALVGKDEGADASKNPQLPECNGLNTTVVEYVGHGVILLWARWYDISGAAKVEHSRVFRSVDSGKKWSVVSPDFLGSNYVMDIKFRENTGYVAGNKILQKSVDGGESFTDIYPVLKAAVGADHFINAVTLGEGNEIFVTSVTGVLRSPDGGTTWTKLAGATGGNDFWRFDNNSWMVMGTTAKCFYTNSAASSWVAASPGATIYEIGGVWNDYVYVLGQGKYYRTLLEGLAISTSAVEIKVPEGVTVMYMPTSIDLVSKEKSIERCAIWTVNGQLVSDVRPASNRYSIPYSHFRPGIYITRTLTGGKVFVYKIVIP